MTLICRTVMLGSPTDVRIRLTLLLECVPELTCSTFGNIMYKVYVQNKDGAPLDPTTRFGWVRRSLKSGKAVVVQRKPFVIRLTYQIDSPVTKNYVGGTDPGRTNIGNAVLQVDDSCVIYTDHVETRNKDIPRLMKNRRESRSASRRGERLKRKRRAKKFGTLSKKLAAEGGRNIPGCEEKIPVKDIINTEARFANRKRASNMKEVVSETGIWITPTVKQLVQTHLNQIDNIRKLLPVTSWCLEINRFAFMRMEDGTVRGIEFQNGKMKGFSSVEEYFAELQNGKCAVCGKPLKHIHHILPKSKGGSDGPENRIGLCEDCHHKVHIGELDLKQAGKKQKYATLSVLNQAIPYILQGLIDRFGKDNVYVCFGNETSCVRKILNLEKTHNMDAAAIISACSGIEPIFCKNEFFEVKQFRRHDRKIIKSQRERTYKLDGKTVAKNRKPREEQKGLALSQWFEQETELHGLKAANAMLSRLKVEKSTRYYNNPERLLPGTTFLFNGDRYVMSGQISKGAYYRAVGQGSTNFPSRMCKILTRNNGLVYL